MNSQKNLNPYSFSALVFLTLAMLGLSACTHKEPNFIYMPEMVYSPSFKAQQGQMRMPVPGTLPRGYVPYEYAMDPDAAGRELKNPLMPTMAVLKRGQAMYNTYCIACHGKQGEGDGSVVGPYPRPPSLQSEKVSKWPDGRIYHNIMVGQNLMPSYASQLATADRWAVIHYIRVLQRSKHPTDADMKIMAEEYKQ
jgi:mono/diheme cytochrome c family protein